MDALEFAQRMLNQYYTDPAFVRKNDGATLVRYRHTATGNYLLVIESTNANDGVYETLQNHNNPNLPKIYGIYAGAEKAIIFEEYLEGETLKHYMAHHTLSQKEVLGFCKMLLNAVRFLHTQNIIHRDIKPSNIMICDGVLKLIDFNIARISRPDMDGDTIALGSIGYAAPEQFGLSQSLPSTDIYAIGVLMNEMLTGRHPTEYIAPGRIGKIISKCLHIQASQRYQSIDELEKAIRRLHFR